MKRIHFLLINLFNFLVTTMASEINYSVDFSLNPYSVNVVAENGFSFTELRMCDIPTSGDEGSPAIPMKTISLALPSNAVNLSIGNVQLSESGTIANDQLELYGYDKYHTGTGEEITIIDRNKSLIKSSSTDSYTPMFEVGKMWKYCVRDNRSFTDERRSDCELILRVDDGIDIDGEQWYRINAYVTNRGEDEYISHYGICKEDLDAKCIYFRGDEDFETLINPTVMSIGSSWFMSDRNEKVYDFNDYHEGFSLQSYPGSNPNASAINDCYEFAGKSFRGIRLGNDSSLGIYEGLGIITIPEKLSWSCSGPAFDLVGFHTPTTGGGGIMPYLYSIVDANGTELYHCSLNEPASLDELFNDTTMETSISIENGIIHIQALRPIGYVSISDTRGTIVYAEHSDNQTFDIPTDNLPSGVYIVSASGENCKIAVK